MNRRILTYGLFAVGVGLIALAAGAMPHHTKTIQTPLPPPDPHPIVVAPDPPPPPPPQAKAPKIEVVFALDTTGSMSGLIDGAKRKIWSIANYIASAQPKPELKVGLVAYRDLGDEYVTRFYDLDDDMDTVFDRLSSFRAAGGGDTPEHVARALHDAVDRASWSQGDDVVKMIYLVGDAPPHTDYTDGFDYHAIARRAAKKNIHLNTILCGNDADARLAWNEIARAGQGEFASIAQTGGVAMVTTPYDTRLAELNRELAGTALGYGDGATKMAVHHKVMTATSAPAAIAADRAGWAGVNKTAVGGKGDLVGDLGSGRVRLEAVKTDDLPEEMHGMDAPRRRAYVVQKQEERDKVLHEISDLSRQRNEFLKADAKKAKRGGFDDEVRKTVEKEAGTLLKF
jgi:hypothetical protein